MDFTYSLPDGGPEFRAHSNVQPVGHIRPILSYTSQQQIPCQDIIFIGFNPASAGIPGDDGKLITHDSTVKDVLSAVFRDKHGEFETLEPRITTVTFCNLFAFAGSSLDGQSSKDLHPEEAFVATKGALESNPRALVICGWGLKDFMQSKSEGLWKDQIAKLVPLLKERQCYRMENVPETCDPFAARSWSRRGLGAAKMKAVKHLEELKRFIPDFPTN